MRNHSPLPSLDKVDPAPVHSFSLRPSWHRDHQLFPASTVSIRAFATLPTPGSEVLAPAQRP
jgi:hypothetical protein